jgi:hypothetical protein
VLPLVESFVSFPFKGGVKYEGLKRAFPLENLFVTGQVRDAGTKPAFCQVQLVSARYPEILH